MKKPIKEWLETIADKEIREAAISQIYEGYGDYQVHSLLRAVGEFNLWINTKEGWKYWNNVSIEVENGTLQTREVEATKLKEGYIPYSNEQERLRAIAQAEKMGATESELNEDYRRRTDNCIAIEKAGYWRDTVVNMVRNNIALIPLERPEEAERPKTTSSLSDFTEAPEPSFAFNKRKYTKTEQEDGTIILKPKKKEKVWIEVFFSAGILCAAGHFSKKELEESIDLGKENGETLLEVIEREYEI